MIEIKQAVVIVSAGGSRLGQLTRDRPKAMLPILGKPMIVRILDQVREAGIRQFIVVMGEQEGAVASYLNTSWVPNVQVQIVLQPTARGVGDALVSATNYITGPFLLLSADHIVPSSHIPALIQRQQETNADVVLSVVSMSDDARPEGMPAITVEGERVTAIGEESAPSGAASGATANANSNQPGPRLRAFLPYAGSQRLLNYASSASHNRGDLTSAIRQMMGSGANVIALKCDWQMNLSREIDLLSINKHFLGQDRDTHILSEVPASVRVQAPVRIDPQVSIGPNARIGPNVYIESGAHVGQGAVISNALILNNADIGNDQEVHNQIVGRRMQIQDDTSEKERTRPSRPQDWNERLEKNQKG